MYLGPFSSMKLIAGWPFLTETGNDVRLAGFFSPVKKMQLPATGLRFDRTSKFQLETVRCNLCPNRTRALEISTSKQMFILGMGFVGQFFAAELKTKGWLVSGSCTKHAKKDKLDELGYQAYVFDAEDPQPEILEIVKNHSHLLVSVPPLGDPMLHHKRMVHNILKGGRLQLLVYLSSTGVYGNCGGAWVDEEYPAKPSSELGRARLAAEEEWISLGHFLEIPAHVLRLGGIYGPGRSAVDTILKQEPLSKGQIRRSSKNYTSRVHVVDICQALHASISNPSGGRIYNIVDDDPAPRPEVFEFAQKLVVENYPCSTPSIPCERTESVGARIEPKGDKRVSNARMKKELGVKLLHPTYRSGLRSIIEQVDSSSSSSTQTK